MKRNAERYLAYKITNMVNGKAYIGITSQTIGMRWGRHRRTALKENLGTKLARAIRKHGPEKFSIVQIAEAYSFREIMVLEKALISAHATWHGAGGYNMTIGGDNFGCSMSAERRAQIGAQTKQRWRDGKFSEPPGARSERTKAAFRNDPTYAARISVAKTGKHFTPEQREAMKPSRKKPWEDAAYRERMQPILSKNSTKKFKAGEARGMDFMEKNKAAKVLALRAKIESETGQTIAGDPRTHCARGHERTPENTIIRKGGGIKCRVCRGLRELAYREKVPQLSQMEPLRHGHQERQSHLEA